MAIKRRAKIAFAAIVKNEQLYIREWVQHCKRFADEVLVIEDWGSDSHADALKRIAGVEVEPIGKYTKQTGTGRQLACLTKLRQSLRGEYDWLCPFDVDEFLIAPDGGDLGVLLARFDWAEAVRFPYVTYNANGHVKRPKGGVMASYTEVSPVQPATRDYKSAIRATSSIPLQTHGIYNSDFVTDVEEVWADGAKASGACASLEHSGGWHINHYFTKSRDDWEERLRKGALNETRRYDWAEFFNHNPTML